MERTLAQLRNPVLPGFFGHGDVGQGATNLGQLISAIIGMLFIFATITAFIFLATGAFFWITSGGDKTNLQNARNRIVHAIVGLVVISAIWAVINLVSSFLGVNLVSLPVPSIQ